MKSQIRVVLFTVLITSVYVTLAGGYDSYNPSTPGQVGCFDCHNGFFDRGPLHDLHVGNQDMTNNCDLCHTSTGDNPKTWTSGEVNGQGCRGCHGIDNGTQWGWGAGLRLHHLNAGAPADANGDLCNDCHTEAFAPPPENIPPPYYLRGDVNVNDPCVSVGPGGEDFDGNNKGNDNDGDLVYDESDTDCQAVTGVPERPLADVRGLQVAPNPIGRSDATVTFHMEGPGTAVVAVFDIAGRSVFTQRVAAIEGWQSTALPVSRLNMSRGVYLVRVFTPTGTRAGKLVVM